MEDVESNCISLMQEVELMDDEHKRKCKLREYLDKVENDNTWITFPTETGIDRDLKWVNCSDNLEISDLKGKLVVFDFFTYCCINCLHVMPFLHKMETDHPVSDGLVVIGVHSAKFPNEKLEVNIANAIRRYSIQHPVVNDSDLELWEGLSVKCWPTMILLSPDKKIIFSIPGESHLAFVELFIQTALEYYRSKAKLTNANLGVKIGFESLNEDSNYVGLKFPGKIAMDDLGNRLAISDTRNNRVIICNVDGRVTNIVGGGSPGYKDGEFKNAKFHSPQGVAWHGPNTIFVADCDNHLIRKIDLLVNKVVTIAGTGQQGDDLEGGRPGLDQPISSPWDLLVGGSPRFSDGNSILYAAMSGCHQIWALFLKDADFQKGAELKLGTCIRYAGSGNEENRNNSYPHKAGFAQPSGLAVDKEGHTLYVADSESSTIRKINLANGAVQGVVGGAVDPTNLFAFGDEDGKAREVKLQHPIGVAWDKRRKVLYVADTYNHKIKIVNPSTKICRSIAVTGGEDSEHVFNEPSGLCVDPPCDNLYIADTNNHDIKVLSLDDYSVKSLVLEYAVSLEKLSLKDPGFKLAKLMTGAKMKPVLLDGVTIPRDGQIVLSISCASFNLNQEAPSGWQVSFSVPGETCTENYYLASGKILESRTSAVAKMSSVVNICNAAMKTVPKGDFSVNLCFESLLYYCVKGTDVCKMHKYKATLPVKIISEGGGSSVDINIEIV